MRTRPSESLHLRGECAITWSLPDGWQTGHLSARSGSTPRSMLSTASARPAPPWRWLRGKRTGDPETKAVASTGEGCHVAIRRADSSVSPRTTASDTTAAFAARPWRAIGRRSLVIGVPAILRPLPDVADHIVETKSIRGERPDRRGLLFVPFAAAADAIGYRLAVQLDIIAPGILRLSSGARRIFVLGLGQQPICFAG
jgi:hypothetical protein